MSEVKFAMNEEERLARREAVAQALAGVTHNSGEPDYFMADIVLERVDEAVPVVSMRHHMRIRHVLLRQAEQLMAIIDNDDY